MTKDELSQAVAVATSEADLSNEVANIDIFNGYGLPGFKPVYVTVRQVAALIRWQAVQFDGGVHAESLNELAYAGRQKFQIL